MLAGTGTNDSGAIRSLEAHRLESRRLAGGREGRHIPIPTQIPTQASKSTADEIIEIGQGPYLARLTGRLIAPDTRY